MNAAAASVLRFPLLSLSFNSSKSVLKGTYTGTATIYRWTGEIQLQSTLFHSIVKTNQEAVELCLSEKSEVEMVEKGNIIMVYGQYFQLIFSTLQMVKGS